jgi:hypothetical protein
MSTNGSAIIILTSSGNITLNYHIKGTGLSFWNVGSGVGGTYLTATRIA